jgi:hypothetical protein
MSRGSASAAKIEAEPPDMRYQAEPGNEYNPLGLLYVTIVDRQTVIPISTRLKCKNLKAL